MNKKILFVEPRGPKTNIFAYVTKIPFLGPLYMATYLDEIGYNVAVIKENLVDQETFYTHLKNADILILTLITNYAYRGYEIAQIYRKFRPDGRVIAGGIHVSFKPEEALKYADQVAIGEGNLIIKDLIDNKIKDKIVTGTAVSDLNRLPIPNFSLLVGSHKLKNIPMMTSLGCPYDCTFCCVTKMYGRKYRFQSPDKTISEIKQQTEYFGKKRIFFYDDNFCANKRNSIELFDKIIEHNLNLKWCCQVRADLANDESFIKRMAEAGCYRVYVGFESINEKTLRDLQKKESLQEIENAINIFHKYGIAIHGMFILGTDSDDISIFKSTVDFCIKKRIENAHFFAITLFPGTDFYRDLDTSRILHENWEIMDGFHINVKPKNMNPYELMQGILYAHTKFYSWRNIIKQIWIDLMSIFLNRNRPVRYMIFKLIQDFKKNIEFYLMIKKWKNDHREYHQKLKYSYNNIANIKESKFTKASFKNYHISS